MANVNGDLKRLKVGTNLNINDIKEPTTKITTPGKLQLVWSTPEKVTTEEVTTEIITIPPRVEQTPRIHIREGIFLHLFFTKGLINLMQCWCSK